MTIYFKDGAVTFALVVHHTQVEGQVAVFRHERSLESYRQGSNRRGQRLSRVRRTKHISRPSVESRDVEVTAEEARDIFTFKLWREEGGIQSVTFRGVTFP